jgi:hypothetical protein
MMDYNENTTPTFALFCEHTNLHTFKYGENVCMKQKSLEFFFNKKEVLHHQNARRGGRHAHQHYGNTCGSITFH